MPTRKRRQTKWNSVSLEIWGEDAGDVSAWVDCWHAQRLKIKIKKWYKGATFVFLYLHVVVFFQPTARLVLFYCKASVCLSVFVSNDAVRKLLDIRLRVSRRQSKLQPLKNAAQGWFVSISSWFLTKGAAKWPWPIIISDKKKISITILLNVSVCSRYLRRPSEAVRPHDNVSSISFSCIYSSSKLKFACLRPARVCFVFCFFLRQTRWCGRKQTFYGFILLGPHVLNTFHGKRKKEQLVLWSNEGNSDHDRSS